MGSTGGPSRSASVRELIGSDPGPTPDRRNRLRRLGLPVQLMVAAIVVVMAVSVVTMAVAGQGSPPAAVVNYLAQLAASGLATGAAVTLAVRGSRPGVRRPALIAATGCALWFVGEVIWFASEWIVFAPLPAVSVVDVLFLAFPVLLAAAVWQLLRHARFKRLRMVLDAIIVAASLFVVSWTFVLANMASSDQGTDDVFTTVVSLLYPTADIVALTVLLLGVGQLRVTRIIVVGAGTAMTVIAAGDMIYAYQTAVSTFVQGTAVDLAWIIGFGILAVLWTWTWSDGRIIRTRSVPPDSDEPEPFADDSLLASMLPYLPVAAALIVVGIRHLLGATEVVGELLIILILGVVLLRQYLTLRDNRRLTEDLAARERQLRQQAFHDVLTGLPNRALFTERVVQAVERHRRERRPVALLFIDLDDFKTVNDTLGHPVGDELVSRVGARLRRLVRSTDTVSRFGGDEFAVLVEGDHDAVAMADRLVGELRRPFSLRVRSLAISCSIGIAHVGADDVTPGVDELFSRADIAMYAAKRAGKGQRSSHHPAMVLPEADDLHYRPLLIDALSVGRIDCVFQPIVSLETRRLVSLEALARWYVDGRQVNQSYFIELAGRSGLLPALTDQMLDQVCAHLSVWNAQFGCTDLKVSVNVPPGLMTDATFPARVLSVLDLYEVQPQQLALEITEDALLGDYRTTQVVAQQFRDLGIEVWLDDFGSGYSSLLSLRRICLQSVKIDLEFVANIHRDPEAEQFLGAMLRLTRELGLVVTAEGVELAEQADILTALGCTYGQGFLYSEPVTGAEVERMLERGGLGRLLPHRSAAGGSAPSDPAVNESAALLAVDDTPPAAPWTAPPVEYDVTPVGR